MPRPWAQPQNLPKTTSSSAMADEARMQPTRDPRATLPDLIEVLLNKGVYLNLDLIISVADIPLIGVNLRATIAGIETMLEYGMMRQWDEQTRAWVQKSMSRHLPMADGEELIAKMAGGHYQDNFYRTWRPGSAYLTTERLLIHRRDPAETLWQARLSSIESIEPLRERSVGGEQRTRILVRLADGEEAKLSAVEPERLIKLVQEQCGLKASADSTAAVDPATPLRKGQMWYLESLSGGGMWRAGQATLTTSEGFVWKSPMDSRALVRAPREEIRDLSLDEHDNPSDSSKTLTLSTSRSTVRLAANDIAAWHRDLAQWRSEDQQEPQGHHGQRDQRGQQNQHDQQASQQLNNDTTEANHGAQR